MGGILDMPRSRALMATGDERKCGPAVAQSFIVHIAPSANGSLLMTRLLMG